MEGPLKKKTELSLSNLSQAFWAIIIKQQKLEISSLSKTEIKISQKNCHLISKSQVEQSIIGGVFLPLHMNGPPDYPVGCLQLHMSKQEHQNGFYILRSYNELLNFLITDLIKEYSVYFVCLPLHSAA